MQDHGSVVGQLEALTERFNELEPCPFSRSMLIGWLVQRWQALQSAGLTTEQLHAQLERDYLAWIKTA
ncbi:MAG: hypothetical protein V7751_09730 [Pseudoalteromonas distincta]|tara:strand:- start:14912 stop:15115 length:204 start_codon:yes stop_codon:yes gene_type:complete